jgi:hypothetical protein
MRAVRCVGSAKTAGYFRRFRFQTITPAAAIPQPMSAAVFGSGVVVTTPAKATAQQPIKSINV